MKSILKYLRRRLKSNSSNLQASSFNQIAPPGTLAIGNLELLAMGNRVSFGGNVLLYLNEKIEIGNDTMIAINTVIHTSTHDHRNHPMWQERIDRPVKIGNHVWIGINSIILPGVIIEDFAVIAAGSIVNSNVPRGAIVGGNPARIIQYRDLENTRSDSSIEYPGVIKKEGYSNTVAKTKLAARATE